MARIGPNTEQEYRKASRLRAWTAEVKAMLGRQPRRHLRSIAPRASGLHGQSRLLHHCRVLKRDGNSSRNPLRRARIATPAPRPTMQPDSPYALHRSVLPTSSALLVGLDHGSETRPEMAISPTRLKAIRQSTTGVEVGRDGRAGCRWSVRCRRTDPVARPAGGRGRPPVSRQHRWDKRHQFRP